MIDWITTPHGLLAWAATYLLHSTLLLGAVWAVSRVLAGRSLRLEERLWKAALVGAIVTATIQTGVASFPAAPAAAPAVERATSAAVAAPGLPSAPPAVSEPIAHTRATRSATAATPDPRLSRLAALLPGWQRLALGAWAFGALLLVGGLAARWTLLRMRLRRRQDVGTGVPRRLLDRLLETTASRRRVRLTGSSTLPVPVALGVGEQEICLPRRALSELDDRRQEGLLAHELAHLERRDPAWLLLALGIESVLFFQPLNRLARRRLEEIAELECDAWAVRVTGDRVSLARCLTDVAGWLLEERRRFEAASAPGAAAMARSRGQLGVRVRRILSAGPGDDLAAGRRWLPATAAAALLALALVVPGLSPSSLAAPAAEPQVAPGAEGVPAGDQERETELRAHRAADDDLGHPARDHGDHDTDHDSEHQDRDLEDWDHEDWDFDVDHDFGPHVDAEEIAAAMAQAMAAARAGMLDDEEIADLEAEIGLAVAEALEALESMPEMMEAQRQALAEMERELPEILAEAEREMAAEGHELSPEERARMRADIERELARAHEEMERAMEELEQVGPELEELRSMQHEIGAEVREEMRRVREELVEAEREIQRETSAEARAARAEARAEHREALREAERELADAQREIDEARRELAREREELERERRELERERAEELEEPPGA